jgi:BirA family transcriptional regulator, biotin operon repressor / biotin---[acetyl-CoA-carboxylase] ligase
MTNSLAVPAGYALHYLEEVDSTNSEALRLAKSAYGEKHWVVAGCQTRGRGRRGREWTSKPGNLYASLLLYPDKSLTDAATLSFVAGVAIRQAIVDLAPPARERIGLKWPNDLLLDGKKIAGILLESSLEQGRDNPAIVIGVGINCAHSPDNTEFPATNLASTGFDSPAEALFNRIAIRFAEFYEIWTPENGFAEIRTCWLKSAAGIGKPITVRLGDREIHGVFESLDATGQLILLESNNKKTIVTAGDVFFPRISVPDHANSQAT